MYLFLSLWGHLDSQCSLVTHLPILLEANSPKRNKVCTPDAGYYIIRVQNLSPQNTTIWHVDHFELKGLEKQPL